MQYRLLGKTGIIVSRVCLGAMTFGGATTPPYDKVGGLTLAETEGLVGAALDAGINFIDAADVYAAGESETLLGAALQGRRDEVIVATKFHAPMGKGPNDAGQSRLHIMRSIEGSLRRLRTDHIDLYQIHNFDDLTPMEETLRALDDAVSAGKLRYIGCSNLAAWQAAKACYSLAVRDVEREILPMAIDHGLGVLAWSPLAGGLLSGKFGRSRNAGDASRRTHIDFPPIVQEHGHRVIDALDVVAARHGVSGAQVALAWLLAQPGVTAAIVGARRVEQLQDNLRSLDLALSGEDFALLEQASALPPSYPGWIQAITNEHRARFIA